METSQLLLYTVRNMKYEDTVWVKYKAL